MNESPNDSQATIEQRAWLNRIDELFVEKVKQRKDSIASVEDGQGVLFSHEDEIEAELHISKQLLRTWMLITAADFSNNERHKLIRLTNELLRGFQESAD